MRRNLLRGGAVLCAVALLAAAVWSCGKARAHEFYDQWCCTGKDCMPAPEGSVTWTPAGWSVSTTHEVVPFNDPRIRYTPKDQPQFHLCQVPGLSRLRCLYVPEPEG